MGRGVHEFANPIKPNHPPLFSANLTDIKKPDT